MKDDSFWQIIVGIAILVVVGAMALGKGCSNGPEAESVLRSEGYTDIETGGFAWSCGNDDNHCTSFTATSPSGAHVRGAVGCGWYLKACTIRVESGR
jgi:hypothetical protein